jgi:hypothetical protein
MIKSFEEFNDAKGGKKFRKFSDIANTSEAKKDKVAPQGANELPLDHTPMDIETPETVVTMTGNRAAEFSPEELEDQQEHAKKNYRTDTKEVGNVPNIPETVPVQNEPLQNAKLKATNKQKIELFGKIASGKNIKASKMLEFLSNVPDVKVKSSLWYLIIEKQDSELNLLRFTPQRGINLTEFIVELKKYYIDKYKDDKQIVEAFEKLTIEGNDKLSVLKNISNITIENRKLIRLLTEDLIKLLK